MPVPKAEDFQNEINKIFIEAEASSKPFVIIKSGILHRLVGGYADNNHRMPVCCRVMKQNMQGDDIIIAQPSSGKGATLEIKYFLPR